jgi:hypothetical protein
MFERSDHNEPTTRAWALKQLVDARTSCIETQRYTGTVTTGSYLPAYYRSLACLCNEALPARPPTLAASTFPSTSTDPYLVENSGAPVTPPIRLVLPCSRA